MRHRPVDLSRQLDEPRLESVLLRLPRQVKRVDRNAVPPEARAGIEGHEAERLGRRGSNHFPHVDAQPVAHERDLVHEADVDRAERVLEQLDHLGDFGRAHRHDSLDRRGVQRAGQFRRLRVHAADDFGHVARIECVVARVDAFG